MDAHGAAMLIRVMRTRGGRRGRAAALVVIAGACLARTAFAQAATAPGATSVSGAITVTNNGISTIPTFSLGRPAVTFDVSIRHRRLSIDPQIRYGLDGVPWVFLFWGRYRVFSGRKFNFTAGGQTGVNFRQSIVSIGGVTREIIVARRYIASELQPTWTVARDVGVGGYWLYSRALERDVARNINYVALRANHANLFRTRGVAVQLLVQPYYLRQDDRDGSYINAALGVARTGLPVSLGASGTVPLRTNVPFGDKTVWNVSATVALTR